MHPTQLYEAVLSLVIFWLLLRCGDAARPGGGWRVLGLFLILHGCARAAVELFRPKQDRLTGPITADLLLALATVAVGLALRRARGVLPPTREPV